MRECYYCLKDTPEWEGKAILFPSLGFATFACPACAARPYEHLEAEAADAQAMEQGDREAGLREKKRMDEILERLIDDEREALQEDDQ